MDWRRLIGTDEQARLAEEHLGLVYYHANRYPLPMGMDREDLIDAGFVGMCDALRSFDPALGHAFPAFAGKCIKNRVTAAWRNGNGKSARRGERGQRRKQLHDDLAADPAPSVESRLETAELTDRVTRCLVGLPCLERLIVMSRFGIGGQRETCQQLAGRLNMTPQGVHVAEKRGLLKLGKLMAGACE